MTVDQQAKDDGYCSSESSRCSSSNESSMDFSMEKIIYGIEALIDDFDDPCTFAESFGINCWMMTNNSKQPLEPEKARPSPPIRNVVEDNKVKKQSLSSSASSSRGRQTSWTEKAKAIKASIDKYESKIIPEYRETRKKREDMALKSILHTLMKKNNDLMKNNIKRMEDEAIVEYKISPAKKMESSSQGQEPQPNLIQFLRNAPEPEAEDSSSLVLKKLLGIPCWEKN